MNNMQRSLVNALGTYVYIILVSWVMNNGEKWFGKMDSITGGVAILTLLVLSVAITGGFILGKPILLYMEGKKKEAVKLFHLTICWIGVLAIATFVFLAVR